MKNSLKSEIPQKKSPEFVCRYLYTCPAQDGREGGSWVASMLCRTAQSSRNGRGIKPQRYPRNHLPLSVDLVRKRNSIPCTQFDKWEEGHNHQVGEVRAGQSHFHTHYTRATIKMRKGNLPKTSLASLKLIDYWLSNITTTKNYPTSSYFIHSVSCVFDQDFAMKALHASWLPGAQQHQIVNQPIKLQTKNPLSRPQPWLKCFQSHTFFIWYHAHTDKICESQIVHLGHMRLYQVSNNTSGTSSSGDAKRSSEDIWNIKPILFRSYQSHCASHFWENWGHWSGHISPFVSKPPRGQSTALGGARSLFHSCDRFSSFHFLFNLLNFSSSIQSNAIFVIVQSCLSFALHFFFLPFSFQFVVWRRLLRLPFHGWECQQQSKLVKERFF